MKMMELSEGLKMSQPTAGQPANRGEKIAKEYRPNLLQTNSQCPRNLHLFDRKLTGNNFYAKVPTSYNSSSSDLSALALK